jgi:hypothetical protein
VLVVAESNVSELKLASTFDVDLLVGVDQNIGDGGVLKHGLKGAESKDFIEYFVANLLLLERTEQGGLGVDKGDQGLADFAPDPLIVNCGKRFEIDLIEELAVKSELEFLILRLQLDFRLASILEQALLPTELGF